ncbi:hypothetical protein LDENG_00005100 [Lucifuga dentata]|nr:hypothetical protein LDENG_00005100 [Lucifuga dentata]
MLGSPRDVHHNFLVVTGGVPAQSSTWVRSLEMAWVQPPEEREQVEPPEQDASGWKAKSDHETQQFPARHQTSEVIAAHAAGWILPEQRQLSGDPWPLLGPYWPDCSIRLEGENPEAETDSWVR